MARENGEIKVRFQRIDDWSGLRPPYICGWPNFEVADYHDGLGLRYGHYLLSDAVADWRDAPFAAPSPGGLGAPAEYPLRGMFARTATFAGALGYQHGFPNFQQAVVGGVEVRGTYLIVPGTAVFEDVPAVDLMLGNGLIDPETHSMDEWFWGASRYATSRGYAAGMPSGHRVNTSDGYVCGVWLFPPGTATWVDIPGAELGLPTGIPDPVPSLSGKMVVTLTPSTLGAGYRVATTSDPTTRNAKITSVSNRHTEDISLTHTDASGIARGPVTLHKPPAGFVAGTPVSDFNDMTVAGDWGAFAKYWQGMPPPTIIFEINWRT